MSLQVDRVDRQRIFWNSNYINPNSIEFQVLQQEANYAVSQCCKNAATWIKQTGI